jgi:hypothetical protein
MAVSAVSCQFIRCLFHVLGTTATIKDHSSSGNGMLCTGSHNTITAKLNTCISSRLRGSRTFTTYTFIKGSEPLLIPPPYTSLVSTQTREKKLLAVPSKSPNSSPSLPTYPTYPIYVYPTGVPAAVPTSLPIKSTSYPTSPDTLSGYYTRAAYSDLSCTALYSSRSMKLNSCVYTEGRYWVITATSSSVSIKYHFDELCKDDAHAKEVIPYTTGACVNKVKIIVSPTTVVASTNATSSTK